MLKNIILSIIKLIVCFLIISLIIYVVDPNIYKTMVNSGIRFLQQLF